MTTKNLSLIVGELQQEKAYWISKIGADFEKTTLFPSVRGNSDNDTLAIDEFVLDADTKNALFNFCGASHNKIFVYLITCLDVLIHNYTGKQVICIGTTILRPKDDEERTNFLLPIKCHIVSNNTFIDQLRLVHTSIIEAFDHQNYPLNQLASELNLEYNAGEIPFSDIAVTYGEIQDETCFTTVRPRLHWHFHTENDQLMFRISSRQDDYTSGYFKQLGNHFINILNSALADSGTKVKTLEYMPASEKEAILNADGTAGDQFDTSRGIVTLFKDISGKFPDHTAVIFEGKKFSYKELDEQSDALAASLTENGLVKNDLCGIMIDRSDKFVLSALAILKVGATYLPIDKDYPEDRIKGIMEDADPAMMIMDMEFIFKIPYYTGKIYSIDFQFDETGKADSSFAVQEDPELTAYVMYTSGTTGKPKGIEIHQAGIIRLAKATNYASFLEGESVISFSSFSFDGSTVDIYTALLNGATLVIASKDQIFNLDAASRLISNTSMATFFMTNTLFNLLVDYHPDCFESAKKVLIGGEIMSWKHAHAIVERYGDKKLANVYGPTEDTGFSTYFNLTRESLAERVIPIGKAISNSRLYILDGNLRVVPAWVSGEIYISGKGLAKGYYKDKELTDKKFLDHPYEIGKKIYQTGDLGYRNADGQIVFIGRKDDQVKIRGHRIELGDIKTALLNCRSVTDALIMVREDAGDRYLHAYAVTQDPQTSQWYSDHLKKTLPEYMLPKFVTTITAFPLNSSGKIDKKRLPAPEYNDSEQITAVTDVTEQAVLEIWSELLNMIPEKISTTADFFELGGHSLKAILLISRIQQQMNVIISLNEIFVAPTIKAIAKYIKSQQKIVYLKVPRCVEAESYRATANQTRLYFLQKLMPESLVYNVPFFFELTGQLDVQKMTAAVETLFTRHEGLRTRFIMERHEVRQVIDNNVNHTLGYHELAVTVETLSEMLHSFVRPFNLSVSPLFRADLIKTDSDKYYMVFDIHHIVSDGVSMNILVTELIRLYQNETLDQPELQFRDFAEWQGSDSYANEQYTSAKEYWHNQLSGELPVLDLPLDFLRPVYQQFDGASIAFHVEAEKTAQLKDIATSNKTTLYSVLLAALNVLLAKMSRQHDIIIGSPSAGRTQYELEHIVGFFVNTLILRNAPEAEKSFTSFLDEVHQNNIYAIRHQVYHYDSLVAEFASHNDFSRNPLFDVMFSFQNMELNQFSIEGLNINNANYNNNTSKFDLNLIVFEAEESLYFELEYNTSLFSAEKAGKMITWFNRIISLIIKTPEIFIKDISIATDEEVAVIKNYNNTDFDYGKDFLPVHKLISQQAEKHPDHVAIVFGEQSITYRALEMQAGTIAGSLVASGIRKGYLVIVLLEKSIDMMIGALGVLKAGGCFLLIDPRLPATRIKQLAEESGCAFIIRHDELPFECDAPNKTFSELLATKHSAVLPETDIESAAYMIFTSGTTGNPKGVTIPHRGLTNFLYALIGNYSSGFTTSDNCLSISNTSFDTVVMELFMPLISGAKLFILNSGTKWDVSEIAALLEQHITFTYIPPVLIPLLTTYYNRNNISIPLNKLCTGSESIKDDALKAFSNLNHTMEILNCYGPTETTIATTMFSYQRAGSEGNVSIGKPIRNSKLHIADEGFNIVPVGIPGEIFIAGTGVGIGYRNADLLTSDKFIANRWDGSGNVYRTGDLAFWDKDGNITFIGRLDQQVKIGGVRIEPGEVETALLTCEMINNAVVIAKNSSDGKAANRILVAYYTTSAPLSKEHLRSFLKNKLPEYMIPSVFIELERMPMSSSGKIDRKILPDPELTETDDYVAPETDLEIRLAEMWAAILDVRVAVISVHANFFEIGGNSIKVLELLNVINSEFSSSLKVVDLFIYNTIAGIAGQLPEYELSQEPIEEFRG